MQVSIGRAVEVPSDRGLAVADGQAVALRVGGDDGRDGEIRVYINRCPHEGLSLGGGLVRDGVLICPHHFWRFDATTGQILGSPGTPEVQRTAAGLEPLPCQVVGRETDDDGTEAEVLVDLPEPEPEPERSIRERLLEHARTWRSRFQS